MGNKDSVVKKKSMDTLLLFATLVLLGIGLVMVASASSYSALAKYGDQNILLKSQARFAVIGVLFMFFISKLDYNLYKKHSYLIYIISAILMLLVFVPGIGKNTKGATRWIVIGSSISIQPSEFMKIALAMAVSKYITENYKNMHEFKHLIVPVAMLTSVVVIMYFQNHLSGSLVMIAIAGSIILASGIKIKKRYIFLGILLLGVALYLFLFGLPWQEKSEEGSFRLQRIIAHFKADEDDKDVQWQGNQSLFAVGSGGVFGRGLGQSRQKYLYLPEAQNDFIFSIYAEEFGFVGSVIVIGIFFLLIYRGYIVAAHQKDMYSMLLATGITTMLAFQTIVNIAVVTAIIPVTGMPLPLFSFGGTALVINLAAIGVLLNLSRYVEKEEEKNESSFCLCRYRRTYKSSYSNS